jgi:hypothetical protein
MSFHVTRLEIWDFKQSPSKYDWHNPQGIAAKHPFFRTAPHARLLCRDEVGGRICLPSESIGTLEGDSVEWGAIGDQAELTYVTKHPYGYLPPPFLFTFPDTAPYGWCRCRGTRPDIPEGWHLVPPGYPVFKGDRVLNPSSLPEWIPVLSTFVVRESNQPIIRQKHLGKSQNV